MSKTSVRLKSTMLQLSLCRVDSIVSVIMNAAESYTFSSEASSSPAARIVGKVTIHMTFDEASTACASNLYGADAGV